MQRSQLTRGRARPLVGVLWMAWAFAPAIAVAEAPAGIYVLSTGRDNPVTPQDERLGNIRSYDFVAGYTLRMFWSDIEPVRGQYDFDVVDAAIQALVPLGQGLSIEVLMAEEPAYVLAGAAATYLDHRGGSSPVPWDPFAQDRHAALMAALGSHVVSGAGAPHPLRESPTLKSIDASPVGLNYGVRDLNSGIRNHPDYTQQRYVDAVVAGVDAAASAFPHDVNFLAFFAFNDSPPGEPVDEQIIDRLAPLYNHPGQPELAFFIENLSDDGPAPMPNGMGTGNNLLDWVAAGGTTMMQALDSWLVHSADRNPQLDSLNPATGIALANGLYGTRFFELYKTDLDLAVAGARDAAGRPIVDDLRAWNAALTLDADFDGNGVVNGGDLARWASSFGQTGVARPQGDADGDGDVDGSDFVFWQRQVSAAGAARAVPEPGGLAFAAAVAAAVVLRRAGGGSREAASPNAGRRRGGVSEWLTPNSGLQGRQLNRRRHGPRGC